MLLTIEEQQAQAEFLATRERYQSAKREFSQYRLSAWQLQIVRDQYVAAIAAFAVTCGAVPKWDFDA